MDRMLRTVPPEGWPVSDELGARKLSLQKRTDPRELLNRVIAEAWTAEQVHGLEIGWQHSCERLGFYRLTGKIELTDVTLDQFFNGCSGYRAQYALSPEEGILYNRDIVQSFWPVIRAAYERRPLSDASLELLKRSFLAPHSKVWIANEKKNFNAALPDTISPPRWVTNKAALGRRAPLLAPHLLDLKGCFINPKVDGELFVDDIKLDRASDIFLRGFT